MQRHQRRQRLPSQGGEQRLQLARGVRGDQGQVRRKIHEGPAGLGVQGEP
ncbi:hypothetical protein [Streptomyces sp. NPDC024089]